MLSPTLLFVGVVLTSRAFQAYGEIDLLTDGGPVPQDSTQTADVPDLRHDAGDAPTPDCSRRSRCCCSSCCSSLALVQLRGLQKRVHYGAESRERRSATRQRVRPGSADRPVARPLRPARRRRRSSCCSPIYTMRRRVAEAGQQGARPAAAAGPLHARHVPRRVDARAPRPLPRQLDGRRGRSSRVAQVVTSVLSAYAFAFLRFPLQGVLVRAVPRDAARARSRARSSSTAAPSTRSAG